MGEGALGGSSVVLRHWIHGRPFWGWRCLVCDAFEPRLGSLPCCLWSQGGQRVCLVSEFGALLGMGYGYVSDGKGARDMGYLSNVGISTDANTPLSVVCGMSCKRVCARRRGDWLATAATITTLTARIEGMRGSARTWQSISSLHGSLILCVQTKMQDIV